MTKEAVNLKISLRKALYYKQTFKNFVIPNEKLFQYELYLQSTQDKANYGRDSEIIIEIQRVLD